MTNMKIQKGVTLVELLIVVSIFLVMFVILAPFVQLAKERANKLNCATNLRQISLGLHNYAIGHNNVFPPSLGELYPNYISDEKILSCPAGRAGAAKGGPGYKYIKGLTEVSQPKDIIVEDLEDSHRGRGKNMLRIDGSVEWIGKARK